MVKKGTEEGNWTRAAVSEEAFSSYSAKQKERINEKRKYEGKVKGNAGTSGVNVVELKLEFVAGEPKTFRRSHVTLAYSPTKHFKSTFCKLQIQAKAL